MIQVINKAERFIAKSLKRFPLLKTITKHSYFVFFGFVGRWFVGNSLPQGLQEIGEIGCESFKGYYDVSPENEVGLIFVYSTEDDTRKSPCNFTSLSIAIYESSNLKKALVCRSTRAFNWQQGSRAHWIDSERLIYNDFCTASYSYVSKVWNVRDDKIEKVISRPIESRLNRQEFLSLNFERIASLRPDYGYFAHSHSEATSSLEQDGIWKVDIRSGKSELLYSIAEILKADDAQYPEGTEHKLNHLMVSPNGDKCLAVHRYFNGAVRQGRMLLLSMDVNDIVVLPTGKVVSHYCWINNSESIAFVDNDMGNLKYYRLNVDDQTLRSIESLSSLGDGHPTPLTGNEYITDTYPNRWGYQKLLQINGDEKPVELGSFEHKADYNGESRCDLHPVFCSHSGFLYFDSLLSKKRRLYRMKIGS
jgi:hypothetical protein